MNGFLCIKINKYFNINTMKFNWYTNRIDFIESKFKKYLNAITWCGMILQIIFKLLNLFDSFNECYYNDALLLIRIQIQWRPIVLLIKFILRNTNSITFKLYYNIAELIYKLNSHSSIQLENKIIFKLGFKF